jgi:hypothetical protein
MSDYGSRRSTEPVSGSQTTEPVSGSAVAGYVFAGVIMITIGTFQAIAGLAAILDDEFFVTTPNYAFEVDVTAWGWIHLLLGLLVAFAGYALFAAKTWARIISLDVWVIWALTRSVSSAEELAA